jgi:hypothetical protein
MRWTVSSLALALVLAAPAAIAQTTSPNVTNAPSAQNSGAGIAGHPGSKSGPAAKPETKGTVGSATDQQNTTVQHQDPSKIQGMPGNKSGPPAKAPSK